MFGIKTENPILRWRKTMPASTEERIYRWAEELIHNPDALTNLVFLALLPLQAEALYGWTNERGLGLPRLLDESLPKPIREELLEEKALPRPGNNPMVEIDLARVPAVSFPWKDARMLGVVEIIKTWRYHADNHRACLYRPLGVAFFYNGLHSGSIGVLRRMGVLPAEEINLEPAFQAGLTVAWEEGHPVAVLPTRWGRTLKEPFPHPSYGLLWALARLFWDNGVSL
uniref:Uncharacterized protein n=1 Tax=Thermus caliditerrae TaxID=1330700 RepID=A0A7C5REU0_9DEIN